MLKKLVPLVLKTSMVALAAGVVVIGVGALSAPSAQAQSRDPAYASARAAGLVGEKTDGYLGFPVPPSAELRRMAEDINIKRRALYAQKASEQHATVEDYAFTSGCLLISQTRCATAAAPDRLFRVTNSSLSADRCGEAFSCRLTQVPGLLRGRRPRRATGERAVRFP
jgi:uncharacterized protein